MRITSSSPAVSSRVVQEAASSSVERASSAPSSTSAEPRDAFESAPSSPLQRARSALGGALLGGVSAPIAVAAIGTGLLTLAGVTPYGAAGLAAMATLKSAMAGAAWIGAAVGGAAGAMPAKPDEG